MASTTLRSLRALAKSWPVDPLRPTHLFSTALLSAASRVSSRPSGEQDANRMLGALTRIREGKVAEQYPTPQSLKAPASYPGHYEKLLEGIKKAQRGEELSWWEKHKG